MTGGKDNICFLVITYNAECYLTRLFKSIDKRFDIFAVDNGSSDDTIKMLNNAGISFAINTKNGYAAGVNKGLRILKDLGYKYVFVLNQDTEIIEFEPDYDLMEKYAVVQPLILNNDSTVGVDELKMNVYGFIYPYRYRKQVNQESKELFFFSGAGFIINLNKYLSIGDFDENYFMYYEDADYAVKCFLAGEKAYFSDKIRMIHLYRNSVASIGKIKQLLRSRKIFINKYFTKLWRLMLFMPNYNTCSDTVSGEDKKKFTGYIIGKTFHGFKTRQVPVIPRIIFNTCMYFYSAIIKLTLKFFIK